MSRKNVFFIRSILCLLALVFTTAASATYTKNKPLLLIGGSYANANTPLDKNLQGPLFGISVDAGDYIDLGAALTRLGAKVRNEGQAGASTFSRPSCNPVCGEATWDSYPTQLQRALLRVAQYDQNGLTGYNAKYVIISIGNDCLHSDSFGIDQNLTSPCTVAEMHEAIDRLIAVGQQVLDLGMTPVYSKLPKARNLDLPHFAQSAGLNWAISPDDFDYFGYLYAQRISQELDDAILVNAWKGFRHRGDGLHPDERTTMRAAYRFLRAIHHHQRHHWY